jgi:hypothetical protein
MKLSSNSQPGNLGDGSGPADETLGSSTLVRPLRLTKHALEQARVFFEDRGAHGCEGTALIAATVSVDAPGDVLVGDTVVIPSQEATPVPRASVTVTSAGDLEVVTALTPDQLYVARIHSHPALAFHSPTDDANPALTHEGAYSIVVPYFGLGLRAGLDVCAVFVREDHRWTELGAGTARRHALVSTDA